MTPRSVSVVIPTKNAGTLFVEVLEGIRQQRDVDVDLVIVDSGSTDQTVALGERYGARVFRIPPASFNHGLTRDMGLREARCDIAVLMTQDATPGDSSLLWRLAAVFDDPTVGGAYARQVARPEADVLTQRNLLLALTGRLTSEVRSLGTPDAWSALSPFDRYKLCNFDNVCSAVRRSAWETIPFGKVAFAEDIVWSRRALCAGWKIAYVAESHVIHSHERPLRYDFQRTYLTHRKLFEEYGLALVPTLNVALAGITASIRQDWSHVRAHERSRRRKLKLLLKVPFLSIACVLGQYVGARDERLGNGKDVSGI